MTGPAACCKVVLSRLMDTLTSFSGNMVLVDDQDVVPLRLDALMRNGLWKSWKAEVRFPLSHDPGCCYEHGSVGVAGTRGLKPRSS